MNISEKAYNPVAVAVFSLRDPVTKTRLSRAVNIVPCCCRVNEETVEKIAFVVKDKFRQAPENTPCPVCKEMMQGVYVDLWTRKAVEQFYQAVAATGSKIDVPPETQKPWEGPVADYPKGPRGAFKMDKPLPGNDGLSIYQSEVNDSPLRGMCFTFNNYERFFTITYTKNSGFTEFLTSRGVYLDDLCQCDAVFDEPEQMKQIFELLVQYNDFPQADVERIRKQINETTVCMPQITRNE